MYKVDQTNQRYQTGNLEKGMIQKQLRKRGCRITRQRELLLDIILQGDCASCKEIYFMASKKDGTIGLATIYRMMNLLEEMGALKWRNEYQICELDCQPLENCFVELEDASRIELQAEHLREIFDRGMESCGYTEGRKVKHVLVKSV